MFIAFHSKGAQAGKSTAAAVAAEYLREKDRTVEVNGFGEMLKLIGAKALGVKPAIEVMDQFKMTGQVSTRFLARNGLEAQIPVVGGRDFLINLATAIREYDDTWFVRHTLHEMLEHGAEFGVLYDLRFDPEHDAIHEHGGISIEIVRESAQRGFRSEQGLSQECDYTIYNNGTPEALQSAVTDILDHVMTTYRV